MEGRGQFTFYRSFYEAVSELPKKSRLGVYEAVMEYALDGKEPKLLDGVQKAAFILIKPVLDASEKKARAGRLGAAVTNRQKRGKGEKEKENEIEIENETETENETEDERLPEGFCEFWDLYPVKLGKDKALSAWIRCRPDTRAACDGVKKWVQTKQWNKDNGRFIPRAAKFIEERHYEHLPRDHIPVGASGVLGQAELEAIRSIMGEK